MRQRNMWAISTTETGLTAHVVIDSDINQMEESKHSIKHTLEDHEISHETLEFETPEVAYEHEC